jgi:hypothetical protein
MLWQVAQPELSPLVVHAHPQKPVRFIPALRRAERFALAHLSCNPQAATFPLASILTQKTEPAQIRAGSIYSCWLSFLVQALEQATIRPAQYSFPIPVHIPVKAPQLL